MTQAARSGMTSTRLRTVLLVLPLLSLGLVSEPAQARGGPADDARIGALNYVVSKARRLEARDVSSVSDRRVARGEVGACRRLRARLYDCAATYHTRLYRGGAPSERSTCTETVRVRVSSIEAGKTSARSTGRLRCAEDSTAATQGIPDPRGG